MYTGGGEGVSLLTTLSADGAYGAYDASVADLDGDGTADIVVAAGAGDEVTVFKGACVP
ncbi:hypothetical protein [Streptomyces sp. NPDC054834]